VHRSFDLTLQDALDRRASRPMRRWLAWLLVTVLTAGIAIRYWTAASEQRPAPQHKARTKGKTSEQER